MIQSSNEILKTCNYTIAYNFTEDGQGRVNVSFDDLGVYSIKWNTALKAVCSNWSDISFTCQPYVAPIIASLILKRIADTYQFPYRWINFQYENNPTRKFYFTMALSDEDYQRTMLLEYLTDTLTSQGLTREIVKLAKDNNIWDGLKEIVKFTMDININDE